ncbi:hypothetical protein B0H16DRAFT_1480117 [Mycena metata]|uniref:Uncharacterized protein n=1 Tax=Mycena metata TaxID=1033252 RepID=A0AAD7H4G6_9AGAR|nr:hypothetical protein B0H16DRAFT_1480117 [Mycena metata]
MACVPPWSPYTLPRRGKIHYLPVDFTDILEDEVPLTASRHHPAREFPLRIPDEMPTRVVSPAPLETPAGGKKTDSDNDYLPSGKQQKIWSVEYVTKFRPYVLRPRLGGSILDEFSFVLHVFRPAHLKSLGFKFINWHQSVTSRSPAGSLTSWIVWVCYSSAGPNKWPNGNELSSTRVKICCSPKPISDNLAFGGFCGPRPQNIRNGGEKACIAAALRELKTIQDVTSFQNVIMRNIGPRLWNDAHETLESILDNDICLRLPFRIPNERSQPQPTAFSTVEYRFGRSEVTPPPPFRLEKRDRAPGWRALTSLGNYQSKTGQMVFWKEKTVVEFPCGSTMLFPAEWMPYSFTEYVANGLSTYEADKRELTEEVEAVRRRAAGSVAAALYPTVHEYDREYNDGVF